MCENVEEKIFVRVQTRAFACNQWFTNVKSGGIHDIHDIHEMHQCDAGGEWRTSKHYGPPNVRRTEGPK
jgi:hypothetical protein